MHAERPITLTPACVRALLDGRKTQLRQVARDPLPSDGIAPRPDACPAGGAGDRLWVQERWACRDGVDGAADPAAARWHLHYEADAHFEPAEACNCESYAGGWRPAKEMPRWACRLLLEIDRVRVERVQAIGDADLDAEGVVWRESTPDPAEADRDGFARWWSALHAARGAGWEHDPWVWVVELHRVAEA